MKARIPRGTRIWGTFPGPETKVAGRTYTVKVHGLDDGYPGYCCCRTDGDNTWTDSPETPHPWPMSDGHGKHCTRPRPASVCWVGAGGYWHYARLDAVTIMEGG